MMHTYFLCNLFGYFECEPSREWFYHSASYHTLVSD